MAMAILVVDDDRRMVRTTCDILTVKGYEATGAFTGEEALEKLKDHAPDCVLMDIKMPGLSGIEALKRMRAMYPQLPVVLVSAYASDDVIAEAKQHGAHAVLSKPINFQTVLSFLALLCTGESILVVDDDPTFCKTLKDVLTWRGYQVDTETQAQHVLEDLEHVPKLVVLLDLKLGAVDGVDVLQTIRARYPTQPVILVTGYREEMSASIDKALGIGAYTCLYKPLEVEALCDVIEEISRQKRQAVLGDVE